MASHLLKTLEDRGSNSDGALGSVPASASGELCAVAKATEVSGAVGPPSP